MILFRCLFLVVILLWNLFMLLLGNICVDVKEEVVLIFFNSNILLVGEMIRMLVLGLGVGYLVDDGVVDLVYSLGFIVFVFLKRGFWFWFFDVVMKFFLLVLSIEWMVVSESECVVLESWNEWVKLEFLDMMIKCKEFMFNRN